ncbi:MAG TPA: adenylyl-sulfate kinase, partial [Polyangiaceae bacterium]
RRIGRVAKLLSRNGVAVIVAVVSPYELAREKVRERIERFAEVWVSCPPAECERRDVKGMYRQARDGVIANFTGVDGAYEPPTRPEVTVYTLSENVDESASRVFSALVELGFLKSPSASDAALERGSRASEPPRPESDAPSAPS